MDPGERRRRPARPQLSAASAERFTGAGGRGAWLASEILLEALTMQAHCLVACRGQYTVTPGAGVTDCLPAREAAARTQRMRS